MATTNKLFPIFLSHGAPTIVLQQTDPTHIWWKSLGQKLSRPNSILVISAHWESDPFQVTSCTKQIYDFYGFPKEMYKIKYTPPSNPTLAQTVAKMLLDNGLECEYNSVRGIDHGTWIPLYLIFPKADIPVVQLSLHSNLNPALHLKVGTILRPLLQQNVLIIGSGGSLHNFETLFLAESNQPPPKWALEWEDWLHNVIKLSASERNDALEKFKEHPYASLAHPREEHLLPLHVISGVATPGRGQRIHYGTPFGMSAFEFDTSLQ